VLVEEQRLVGQQRDDVGAELAIARRFGQAECGEQVSLGQGCWSES
jgi:hypothetical protein